ncbi:hypothetical protein EFN63_01465 [Leuconostoc citreum]|uniref:Uncharacterized protein n=1 Tax=Leuconostoc citreum TaxID=33964 RepID=A0A5A5U2W9_LEUCI|nr:hypothetical protein [Leuconostoc citreum]MCT3067044.1 hypothetical protein [Leuconostoc citreum]TDG65689.1 hypothetical protein C5L21_000892 [Leuconostoc citreum]GDZ84788.1 hypothetical protein LCIT_20300 [Leuconostoc citreum]GDZ85707.1 hypothetical protein LCTS_09060 [Leuconostoc citreum]
MIATMNFFKWFGDKFTFLNQSYQRFITWFVEHQRRNLLVIFGIFMLVAVSVTILVSVVPRPSNIPSTPLNTPMPFGSMNKSATLAKSAFNPKNGVLELHYRIANGGDSKNQFVDINNIYFTAIADTKGRKVKGYYIPTSNNTMVVKFTNLSPKFNVVTVTAHDKNINTNKIDAPNSASAIASSSNATKASQSEINQGKFTVNRDKVSYSNTLRDASQRTLTIEEYQDKIANQNEVIGKNKQAIASYQKAIEQQTDAIKELAKQQVNTTDSSLQTSIENARSSITQIRSQISEARNNIGNAKTKVETYEATIKQVKKGHSQLPKTKEI